MDNIYGIVILAILAGLLTIYTIVSNLMVIIAFRVNKKLHTLSNYCLVSLAVSDLTVGVFLMPMFTVYLFIGYWPLGELACHVWLSLDYGLCAASVVNLLVIAIDRLLSVTRPLTYRRTPRKMGLMIASAWIISMIIWPPWIFAWPYIDGQSIVPVNECFVQFLVTSPMMTTLLSILSFYTPVVLTTILYVILYIKTEQRFLKKKAMTSSKIISTLNDTQAVDTSDSQHTTSASENGLPSVKSAFACCCCYHNSRSDNESNVTNNCQTGRTGTPSQDNPQQERCSNESCETQETLDMDEAVQSHPNIASNSQTTPTKLHATRPHHHEVQPGTSVTIKALPEILSFQEYSGDYTTAAFESIDVIAEKALARRPIRHSDSRMAKILSATLLSLIITNGPYYTTAVIESFFPGSINLILGGIGKSL